MPTGLDLLNQPPQQAPQNGLDVLAAGPIASAQQQQPVMQGGGNLAGLVQGVTDVGDAAAQMLYNAMPQSIQNLGKDIDAWTYEHTGGALGIPQGMDLNQSIAARNAAYEQARQQAGRGGVDWMRGAGSAIPLTALTAMTGGTAGPGMAGAMAGAATPVTDPDKQTGGNFLWEKVKQSATGAATGKILSSLGGAALDLVNPQLQKGAKALQEAGITLTPGQALGGMLKTIEDKMTSVPVLGTAITNARNQGIEDLNKAAYQRVIDPLKAVGIKAEVPTEVGREGVEAVTNAVKGAYNDLVPKLTLTADSQLMGELGSLRQAAAAGLPQSQANEFNRIMSNVVDSNLTPNGSSSGKFLQGMLSKLKSQASGYQSSSDFNQRQLGDALATAAKSVDDALLRSNPQYAKQLSGINEAFANLARVQTAAQSAGAVNGVFSPAQLAAAVRGADQTVRNNATAQGKALMQDLSDPAKAILPSGIPDSGTAGRLNATSIPGLIGGAIGAVPSLAYSKPALTAINNYLGGARNPAVQALAQTLQKVGQKGTVPLTAASVDALASYLKNREAAR